MGSNTWPTIVSAHTRKSLYDSLLMVGLALDIQIWAPQQARSFSLGRSKNALLGLVLPLAFQDAMLFEATIAMTRAAWVMRKGLDPFEDKMLLRHRGYSLKELRNRLGCQQRPVSDEMLLTMSTLLTLNVRRSLSFFLTRLLTQPLSVHDQ